MSNKTNLRPKLIDLATPKEKLIATLMADLTKFEPDLLRE